MNRKIVRYVLGKTLIIEAILMLLPLFVSFIYKERNTDKFVFIVSILITLVCGILLEKTGEVDGKFYSKEALVTVSLAWILISLMGCLPLYFTPLDFHTFHDALFEMISGFTTTGASVATNLENLPHSILFWRSFSHFIGGMGILVFTLAIFPKANRGSSLIMKAEVPGPTFGKLVPKLTDTARLLYVIYLFMTVFLIIVLNIFKLDVFDCFIYAFGTAGTGGFAAKDLSVGYHDSRVIEIILTVGMLAFGVNFNLYYFFLFRQNKNAFKSEEFKVYLLIAFTSSMLIFFNIKNLYGDTFYELVNSFFTVSSIMTTTGFVTTDFSKWPLFSQMILIFLMFVGGSAGSTAGGLKVSRIIIAVKSAVNEVKQIINPNRVTAVSLDSKAVDEDTAKQTSNYILVYVMIFAILLILFSIQTHDFKSAFAAVATTINNIGPGLGAYGPMDNFSSLEIFSKYILMFAMLIGRLEIFPILILFLPRSFRKKA